MTKFNMNCWVKHVVNVVILTLLLVGISSCYSALIANIDVLYEDVPTSTDERLVYVQELMDVVKDGIMQHRKTIDIRAFRCDISTLEEVMFLISFYDPLCSLYLNGYHAVPYFGTYVRYIVLDYSVDDKSEYVANEIAEIVSVMDDNMSDLDKVIWINNYICKNYQYDDDLLHDDVFEMLSTGEGTCSSYTQMFILLANESGLPSSFAISFTMQHVWNVVEVDGNWYNIDVTWNDDDTYTYCYLSSDEAMLSFHSYMRNAEDTIQFISCNDTRYDRVQLSEE